MDAAELAAQQEAVDREVSDYEARIAAAEADGDEDKVADLKEGLKAAKASRTALKKTEPQEAEPELTGNPEYDQPDAGWRSENPGEAAGTDTEVSEEKPENYGPEQADADAQANEKNTDDVSEAALEATYGDESLAKDPAVAEAAEAREAQKAEETK